MTSSIKHLTIITKAYMTDQFDVMFYLSLNESSSVSSMVMVLYISKAAHLF